MRWSRYCWHHQSWGTTLAGFVVSAILAPFLINIVSAKYLEAKYRVVAKVNGREILRDTVFRCPKTTTTQKFTFQLLNMGDVGLTSPFMVLKINLAASNVVHAPQWVFTRLNELPPPEGSYLHSFYSSTEMTLAQKGSLTFPPVFADAPNVTLLSLFLRYGSGATKPTDSRLRIWFDRTATNVTMLYGKAAQKALERAGLEDRVSRNSNIAKTILSPNLNSNMVQRYGPPEGWPDVRP